MKEDIGVYSDEGGDDVVKVDEDDSSADFKILGFKA